MSHGLPGFTLQTADDESRLTCIGMPLLYFPLKTVQTWVIFLCWIPEWKCKHGASVCRKPCQNQRKFTEFTRIRNEGTFFLKENGRIEAKLVYFFYIKFRFMTCTKHLEWTSFSVRNLYSLIKFFKILPFWVKKYHLGSQSRILRISPT